MGKLVGVILAAGKGVRMKSELPKVLHEVAGMPMLFFVISTMRRAEVDDLTVVVGSGKEMVRERFAEAGVSFVDQDQQLGTGHAVMTARSAFENHKGSVVVINGDNPLLRAETIERAVELRDESDVSCVVVTAEVSDPFGYGRVIRSGSDLVECIIEERDADEEQRKVREVNSGNYVFNAPDLLGCLWQLNADNEQGEYLLTDVVKLLNEQGEAVRALKAVEPTEVLGINSRRQLADAGRLLQRRINDEWMVRGVTLVSPETTFIDPRATFGVDTVIEPCVVIRGAVAVGTRCHIGPFVELTGPMEVSDGEVVTSFSESCARKGEGVGGAGC